MCCFGCLLANCTPLQLSSPNCQRAIDHFFIVGVQWIDGSHYVGSIQ